MKREYGTTKRPKRFTRQLVIMVTPEMGKRLEAVAAHAEVSLGTAVRDIIATGITEFEVTA